MNKDFNFNKLIIAREYNRLTQNQLLSELKERFSIKLLQSELCKIEKGERKTISENLLQAISEILDFPTSYFYLDGTVIDVKLSLFRKRQKLSEKIQSHILGTINVIADACKNLADDTRSMNINVPFFSLEKYKKPEEIARTLRLYWNVPQGPIENLTNLLEDNGIIINFIKVDDDKFDGYSYTDNDLHVIVVNSALSGDRLRYTLAHELGHTIMKNEYLPHKEAEDTANSFASEFLMPEHTIKPSLRNINYEKAYYLKSYWKVSMASLFRRAKDLGVINQNRYVTLNCYMSQLGYRKTEPNPITKEYPSLFKEILLSYQEDDNYTIEEIAEKACLSRKVLLDISNYNLGRLTLINNT